MSVSVSDSEISFSKNTVTELHFICLSKQIFGFFFFYLRTFAPCAGTKSNECHSRVWRSLLVKPELVSLLPESEQGRELLEDFLCGYSRAELS